MSMQARIVDEAVKLSRRGLHRLKMGDVAEAVGISRPAVHYHVGSIETLRQLVAAQARAQGDQDVIRWLEMESEG